MTVKNESACISASALNDIDWPMGSGYPMGLVFKFQEQDTSSSHVFQP